ncbi:MAG: hypothetical protein PHI19_03760 [Clostridia bacterium]|nr:hypothetical protein [Clostridia bacterium]
MKNKLKLPIKTYLFYLILVAVLITGTSFSRYIVSTGGQDTIGVAKHVFQVDITKDGGAITLNCDNIKPGDSHNYAISVSNDDGSISDIAIEYYIVITTTNNLPLDLTLTEDATGGSVYTPDSQTIKTKEYELDYVSTDSLRFILNVYWDPVNNSAIHQGLSDTITITVHWSQKTS